MTLNAPPLLSFSLSRHSSLRSLYPFHYSLSSLLPSLVANILWRWLFADLHPFPTRPVVACPLANLVIIFIFISFFSLAGQLFSNSCCFFTVFSSPVSSSFSILFPLSVMDFPRTFSFFLFAVLSSVLSFILSFVLFQFPFVASLGPASLGSLLLILLSFFPFPLLSALPLPQRTSAFSHERRHSALSMLTGGCRMRHARQVCGRNAGVREHARGERVGAVRVSQSAYKASGWKECESPSARERVYGRRRRGGEGGGRAREAGRPGVRSRV